MNCRLPQNKRSASERTGLGNAGAHAYKAPCFVEDGLEIVDRAEFYGRNDPGIEAGDLGPTGEAGEPDATREGDGMGLPVNFESPNHEACMHARARPGPATAPRPTADSIAAWLGVTVTPELLPPGADASFATNDTNQGTTESGQFADVFDGLDEMQATDMPDVPEVTRAEADGLRSVDWEVQAELRVLPGGKDAELSSSTAAAAATVGPEVETAAGAFNHANTFVDSDPLVTAEILGLQRHFRQRHRAFIAQQEATAELQKKYDERGRLVKELTAELVHSGARLHEVPLRVVGDDAILATWSRLADDIDDLVDTHFGRLSWHRLKDARHPLLEVSPYYDQAEAWFGEHEGFPGEWRMAMMTACVWHDVVSNVFEDESMSWCGQAGRHFLGTFLFMFERIKDAGFDGIEEANQARLRFLPWILDGRTSKKKRDERLLHVATRLARDLARVVGGNNLRAREDSWPFTRAYLGVLCVAAALHDMTMQSCAVWRVQWPEPRGKRRCLVPDLMEPCAPLVAEDPTVDAWVIAVAMPILQRFGNARGKFEQPVRGRVYHKGSVVVVPFGGESDGEEEDDKRDRSGNDDGDGDGDDGGGTRRDRAEIDEADVDASKAGKRRKAKIAGPTTPVPASTGRAKRMRTGSEEDGNVPDRIKKGPS